MLCCMPCPVVRSMERPEYGTPRAEAVHAANEEEVVARVVQAAVDAAIVAEIVQSVLDAVIVAAVVRAAVHAVTLVLPWWEQPREPVPVNSGYRRILRRNNPDFVPRPRTHCYGKHRRWYLWDDFVRRSIRLAEGARPLFMRQLGETDTESEMVNNLPSGLRERTIRRLIKHYQDRVRGIDTRFGDILRVNRTQWSNSTYMEEGAWQLYWFLLERFQFTRVELRPFQTLYLRSLISNIGAQGIEQFTRRQRYGLHLQDGIHVPCSAISRLEPAAVILSYTLAQVFDGTDQHGGRLIRTWETYPGQYDDGYREEPLPRSYHLYPSAESLARQEQQRRNYEYWGQKLLMEDTLVKLRGSICYMRKYGPGTRYWRRQARSGRVHQSYPWWRAEQEAAMVRDLVYEAAKKASPEECALIMSVLHQADRINTWTAWQQMEASIRAEAAVDFTATALTLHYSGYTPDEMCVAIRWVLHTEVNRRTLGLEPLLPPEQPVHPMDAGSFWTRWNSQEPRLKPLMFPPI